MKPNKKAQAERFALLFTLKNFCCKNFRNWAQTRHSIPFFYFFRFAILLHLMSSKKKKDDKSIFEAIRKPTAPPSKKFGQNKPESKVHPSERKAKHKKKDDSES